MDRRIRLNDVELEQLLSLDGATRSTWRAGQVVIRADADERHVVAVLDGTLQVLQVIDGAGSVPIGSCEVGDVIGEISALTGAPRTADVVAVTDARCVLVPPAAWAEFLAAHPALLRRRSARCTRGSVCTASGERSPRSSVPRCRR